ncbi:MAG: non-homologous end-joining DNA ligase [Dehalococcoidia bacterium]
MITHPDKVLFPDDGITKGEVAAYYDAVAPLMLPHIRGRPLTLERFPRGIAQKGFMQKNVGKGTPDWLERIELPKKDGVTVYPLVGDERSLAWMANQNTITPHVWTSRVPDLEHPDIFIVDLDPSEDNPETLRAGALAVRALLDELGLPSWPKTTGSKGYHIAVPLDGNSDFEQVARFGYAVASLLVARDPEHLTQEFAKADRGTRIFLDVGRNGYGATYAAPYAVRPKPGAPISAPCTWEELESGEVAPQSFTLRTMAARMADVGDLWAGLHKRRRSLRRPVAQLRRLLGDDWEEEPWASQSARRVQVMHEGYARWAADRRAKA